MTKKSAVWGTLPHSLAAAAERFGGALVSRLLPLMLLISRLEVLNEGRNCRRLGLGGGNHPQDPRNASDADGGRDALQERRNESSTRGGPSERPQTTMRQQEQDPGRRTVPGRNRRRTSKSEAKRRRKRRSEEEKKARASMQLFRMFSTNSGGCSVSAPASAWASVTLSPRRTTFARAQSTRRLLPPVPSRQTTICVGQKWRRGIDKAESVREAEKRRQGGESHPAS